MIKKFSLFMEVLRQRNVRRYVLSQKNPKVLLLLLVTALLALVLIFAIYTTLFLLVLQSLGRGLRLKDNKSAATLYDISDDLKHNDKENYTLAHFRERINIYNEEDFNYEIHNVELKEY